MSHYSFSNLCGATYTGGTITFSPKGDNLLVPVGNRICLFDLSGNKSSTYNSQSRSNIQHICYHPRINYAIVIDVNGYAQILNLLTDTILHRIQFKSQSKFSPIALQHSDIPLNETRESITCAKFSPDGKFFIISSGSKIILWKCPNGDSNWSFNFHREYCGHLDHITNICWSKSSLYFLTSSRDMTVRMWSVDPFPDFKPFALVDHRRAVIGAFLDSMEEYIFSISEEGVLITWTNRTKSTDMNEAEVGKKWVREKVAYCNQPNNSKLSKVSYNQYSNILVAGFTTGVFTVYLLPEFESLQTFSTGLPVIDTIDITYDGQWIALASSQTGSLLVWEWKSESYILRQKGHYGPVKSIAFSLNSQGSIRIGSAASQALPTGLGMGCRYLIATGGVDGKLKLWDTFSSFCFCTFEQHSSSIEDIAFAPQGNAVFTASLDGTVCGFDLIRLKLFRIFKPSGFDVQFSCVAADLAGQIVAAGSSGTDNCVYLWNIQTGSLLERLTGHQSTITNLEFHTNIAFPGVLASSSWDCSIRVWNVFGRQDKGGTSKVYEMPSSCLSLSLDPRGNHILAASGLYGTIVFWDFDIGEIVGTIEGFRDIHGGRDENQRFTSFSKHALGKGGEDLQEGVKRIHHFNSIYYSSTGESLIASSANAPNICIYSTETYTLLYSVQLTTNRSLQGILRFLHSNYNRRDEPDSEPERITAHKSLPGVEKGELKLNHNKFQVSKVCFSSDSRQFGVATSHGVFIYTKSTGPTAIRTISTTSSLESFQPQLLTMNVTIQNVLKALARNEYGKSLVLSLALNQYNILARVYLSIPLGSIYKAISELHSSFLPILFNFILKTFSSDEAYNNVGKFVGLRLFWLRLIFNVHYSALASGNFRGMDSLVGDSLLNLQNNITTTFKYILRNLNREMETIGMTLSSNVAALAAIHHWSKATPNSVQDVNGV